MKAQDLIDKKNGVDPKQVWANIRAKQKEQKRVSKKALQRISRLGRYLVKYWKVVALACFTFAVLVTINQGIKISILHPATLVGNIGKAIGAAVEAMIGVIVYFTIISLLGTTTWVAWFSPREKIFDDVWLKHLGKVHKEIPKPEELTWEQHFEDLATEMTKRALEDDEYKALLSSQSGLIKKLFSLDQMRIEARQYYISYYIPMLEAGEVEDKEEEIKDEDIKDTNEVSDTNVHAPNRDIISNVNNERNNGIKPTT